MFFYLARQPILDTNQRLVGYELLFRDGERNAFPNIDDDVATTSLIQNTQLHHSISDITGHVPAYINFAEATLTSNIPTLLNPEEVVIEVLENVTPTDDVKACIRALHQQGYRIALDDYNFAPEWEDIFPCLSLIKVDLQNFTSRKLQILKYQIRDYNIDLLAEKVESRGEFEQALQDGFTLFQGYFFSQPEMIKRRRISPTKAACTELLAESARRDFDFQRMAAILQRDVALTYRLLRFVNAAAFSHRQKITSLHQAVVYLGANEVNRFVSMAMMAALTDDKPNELLRLSIARGRFCELISEHHGERVPSHQAFIVGLFSLLDAMFDEPLSDALQRLNLSTTLTEALLERKGVLAFYLALISSYENAQWKRVEALAKRLQLSHDDIANTYLQATEWSSTVIPHDVAQPVAF